MVELAENVPIENERVSALRVLAPSLDPRIVPLLLPAYRAMSQHYASCKFRGKWMASDPRKGGVV